jgi:hypothetical protein
MNVLPIRRPVTDWRGPVVIWLMTALGCWLAFFQMPSLQLLLTLVIPDLSHQLSFPISIFISVHILTWTAMALALQIFFRYHSSHEWQWQR